MAQKAIPPRAGHNWQPTPSIGRGGTPDGNHNFMCQKCRVKITKADLVNDENIPPTCVRAVRRAA